jgi:hypothetical protein
MTRTSRPAACGNKPIAFSGGQVPVLPAGTGTNLTVAVLHGVDASMARQGRATQQMIDGICRANDGLIERLRDA